MGGGAFEAAGRVYGGTPIDTLPSRNRPRYAD